MEQHIKQQSVDVSRELHERLQACEEQYGLHFAGHPRVTRDPDMLGALIAEVRNVAQAGNETIAALAAAAAATYEQEQQAITAALGRAGPAGRAAAHLGRRASLLMHRYTRHFAGQSRHGRDLGLLLETQEDLQGLHSAFAAVAPDGAAQVQRYIDMLGREHTAIVASRGVGSLAQRAAAWGSAANTLLTTFQTLCLGRRRLAVRPGLILRLVQQLEPAVLAMQALRDAGLQMPHHDEALAQIGAQLQGWTDDFGDSQEAHGRASDEDKAASLGLELDDVLNAYNELPSAAGRAQLGPLCDRMDELERQLRALPESAQQGWVAGDALAHFCARFDESSEASLDAILNVPGAQG